VGGTLFLPICMVEKNSREERSSQRWFNHCDSITQIPKFHGQINPESVRECLRWVFLIQCRNGVNCCLRWEWRKYFTYLFLCTNQSVFRSYFDPRLPFSPDVQYVIASTH